MVSGEERGARSGYRILWKGGSGYGFTSERLLQVDSSERCFLGSPAVLVDASSWNSWEIICGFFGTEFTRISGPAEDLKLGFVEVQM